MTSAVGVVIVGGGPAGLSTWLHLRAIAPDLARTAVLIERESYPREKLCGGGVTAVGDMLLAGLGADVGCPSVPIRRIEIRFDEWATTVEYPSALRVVRRVEFDDALAQVAKARGLDLREKHVCLDVQRVGTALALSTSGGDLLAQVVVAADGAQSVVRRALGVADDTGLGRLIEIVQPTDGDEHFRRDTAIFDFSPIAADVQGYVWHFPCQIDGRAHMNHGIYDSRLHAHRPRAELRTVFARALEQAGVASDASAWHSQPLRWLAPPVTLCADNVILVGDAAGVDPLFGEGNAPSLDYGDLAARLISDAFARNDFSFAHSGPFIHGHPLIRTLLSRGAFASALYAQRSLPADAGPALAAILAGQGGRVP